jgi:hypothetical protein
MQSCSLQAKPNQTTWNRPPRTGKWKPPRVVVGFADPLFPPTETNAYHLLANSHVTTARNQKYLRKQQVIFDMGGAAYVVDIVCGSARKQRFRPLERSGKFWTSWSKPHVFHTELVGANLPEFPVNCPTSNCNTCWQNYPKLTGEKVTFRDGERRNKILRRSMYH